MSAPTVAPAPSSVPARIPAARPAPAMHLSRTEIDEIVGDFALDAYSLTSRRSGGAR